jgi:hypothetical protein
MQPRKIRRPGRAKKLRLLFCIDNKKEPGLRFYVFPITTGALQFQPVDCPRYRAQANL